VKYAGNYLQLPDINLIRESIADVLKPFDTKEYKMKNKELLALTKEQLISRINLDNQIQKQYLDEMRDKCIAEEMRATNFKIAMEEAQGNLQTFKIKGDVEKVSLLEQLNAAGTQNNELKNQIAVKNLEISSLSNKMTQLKMVISHLNEAV
jgi:hypothetical protein